MAALTVHNLESRGPRFARFGDFELDLLTQELRRNGAKVRLQQKPFQVLESLLERQGDIVTRAELQRRLWPADTYVDFESSLNTAVNRLRQTLGDTTGATQFIETLARRGYRFIAPVEWIEAEAPARVVSRQGRPAERPGWRRKLLLLAGFIALLAVMALVVWGSARSATTSAPKPFGAANTSLDALASAAS